jgi:hypothetical protein
MTASSIVFGNDRISWTGNNLISAGSVFINQTDLTAGNNVTFGRDSIFISAGGLVRITDDIYIAQDAGRTAGAATIEVYGQAESWRGNVEAIAEADAMAKLTKFVNGKNVSTERRVKVIGRSIEEAQDNKLDKYKSQDGTINVTDKQIDYEPYVDKNQQSSQDSSAIRNAKAINETIVTTVTNITSKGRLTGVRKIRDFQRNDGKVYVAVYVWSDKDQATSEYIRNRMQGKSQ